MLLSDLVLGQYVLVGVLFTPDVDNRCRMLALQLQWDVDNGITTR